MAITPKELALCLKVGDIVFIRIHFPLFEKIAHTTQSWTNHVGVVIDVSGPQPVIAESRVPLSMPTSLSRFIARSQSGQVAVRRLRTPLTPAQRAAIARAAQARYLILYDTGFNLYSRRQFCSRFVREVMAEATGIELGEVEDFATLLARHPGVDLAFWRCWYFGNIPWRRKTVTPASLLHCPNLQKVFDGTCS